MLPISKYLDAADVRPGDVILCYSSDMREDRPGRQSGYSHAAIYVGQERVLESAGGGVRFTSIARLLDEYNHLVALRNSWAWDEARLEILERFARTSVGKPFNSKGLKEYEQNRQVSLETQMERIEAFFREQTSRQPNIPDELFCSELVVTAFTVCGIIAPSASPVFCPSIFLPQDLANDLLFGMFIGYVIPYQSYVIPEDDYFASYANDPNFLSESRRP
jgi:hypothetical protein